MDVFALDVSSFLPNEPLGNDQLETVLGPLDGSSARMRKLILRQNGIRQRHYAIDPATGETTHTNAQLAAEAVRRLAPREGFSVAEIPCLACGTSAADQLLPGHASMVHAELGGGTCEIVSTGGVCVSGMTALKYAYMAVKSGLHPNAVATGSENASSFLRPQVCSRSEAGGEPEAPGLDAEFLRWMLSDGAGAMYLSATAPAGRPALRIDGIEIVSFAHILETCMYAGAVKNPDGSITGWRELTPQQLHAQAALPIKQDMKLLNREVVTASVDRALPPIIDRYGLRPEQIDWFVPHYSSHYFRRPIYDRLVAIGFELTEDKWFSNLADKGNTGSASIYIILEELLHSGRLRPGQRILCFIPESGRFTISYMLMTVV